MRRRDPVHHQGRAVGTTSLLNPVTVRWNSKVWRRVPKAVIEHWDGRAWAAVPIPSLVHGLSTTLVGAAASSAAMPGRSALA